MKQDKKHIAALLGAGLVSTLSAAQARAQENPFALAELGQAASTRLAEAAPGPADVKSQAGKAAEKMKGPAEMKCGAQMMKKDAKVPDPKAAAGAAGMKMEGAAPMMPPPPPPPPVNK